MTARAIKLVFFLFAGKAVEYSGEKLTLKKKTKPQQYLDQQLVEKG